jgi:signal peptidase I
MDTEARDTQRGRTPSGTEGSRSRFARLRAGSAGASRSGRSPWRRAGLLGGACAVFLLVLSNFVLQPFLIPSTSMEPTLRVGDRVLVNKLAYRFGSEPARGDVVVFDGTGSFVQQYGGSGGNPVGDLLHGAAAALGLAEPADTDFVKRVVGVGGDDVVCCDAQNRIEVNGVPVEEDHLFPGDAPSKVPFRIAVPLGTLWVMGDHRSQSRDSRDHLGSPGGGMVPVDEVIGRVDWIGWPVSRWGTVESSAAYRPRTGPPGPGGGRG